jgi:hypothetical protein
MRRSHSLRIVPLPTPIDTNANRGPAVIAPADTTARPIVAPFLFGGQLANLRNGAPLAT